MLDAFLIGLIGLAALLTLIVIRVPIAYTMILVGITGIIVQCGPAVALNQLKDLAYSQFSNYDLSVLPMFILMGGLASRCGLSQDMFRAANAWLGRFRGGVEQVERVVAAWRWRRSPPAPASARCAARRRPPPRPWDRSPCRN